MNPGHNGVLSEGEAPVEADVEGSVVGDAQAGFFMGQGDEGDRPNDEPQFFERSKVQMEANATW